MNRLGTEASLYLRQHAHQPVHWEPWDQRALDRAKKEKKLIFLSIGYSSCHWCHVMAHECFDDQAVADYLNKYYVSIKVDREERPDLDQIYQNVAQILTKSGGWPLSVFLTSDLKPFFGGTYFPKEDRYGRPGFLRVLKSLYSASENQPEEITGNAKVLTDLLKKMEDPATSDDGKSHPTDWTSFIEEAVQSTLKLYDWEEGGFGAAPKFPQASTLQFLWRFHRQRNFSETLRHSARLAVLHNLKVMALRGLFDSFGGGFHRYCVDGGWETPHFEKMLYDNAALLRLYSEVCLDCLTDVSDPEVLKLNELWIEVIQKTSRFLLTELALPEGPFASAIDADAGGEEGVAYIFSKSEIEACLDESELELFDALYAQMEHGHWVRKQTPRETFLEIGVEATMGFTLLSQLETRLLQFRLSRSGPALRESTDPKMVMSWNAWAVSALVWASEALLQAKQVDEAEKTLKHAITAFEYLKLNGSYVSSNGDLRLKSVLYGTLPQETRLQNVPGNIDDYAAMAFAALDLARVYEGPDRASMLAFSKTLDRQIALLFWDSEMQGYFFSPVDQPLVITRPKTIYDASTPSGQSLAIQLRQIWLSYGEGLDEDFAEFSDLLNWAQKRAKSIYGYGELFQALLAAKQSPIWLESSEIEKWVWSPNVFPKGRRTKTQSSLVCQNQTCVEVDNQNLGGYLDARIFSS